MHDLVVTANIVVAVDRDSVSADETTFAFGNMEITSAKRWIGLDASVTVERRCVARQVGVTVDLLFAMLNRIVDRPLLGHECGQNDAGAN